MKVFYAALTIFLVFGTLGLAQSPAVPTETVDAEKTDLAESKKPITVKHEAPKPPALKDIKDDPAASGTKKDDPKAPAISNAGFEWGAAVNQTLLFLAVQHGFAITTQAKTRRALKGPFFQDYFDSVKSLHGWSDGGKFFTNYIAHPMEGAFLGHVQVQNDPKGRGERFSRSGAYWKSRMKAFAWSAVWSTQFEIGPISQASIGNVGLHGKQTYVDIVITPTVGTAMLVGEDILDRYIVSRFENSGLYWRILSRVILNPTRAAANVMAFRKPWYRDKGLR